MAQSVERLFALEQFGIKLGLDNIRTILSALGHPERDYRSIHIGGTNGKGSVAAMVERALRAAGLKTGRYTSPHLDRIEERVAIDGQSVDSDTFAAAVASVFAAVDRSIATGVLSVQPTFFEVSTAAAFQIFRDAHVDVAVIEVGLGGRFDATNVVVPVIAAITSIAFDHERHLGHTLPDIAFEKAGIAKPGVPLVIGRLPDDAAAKIRAVAADVGAPIVDAHAARSERTYPQLTLSLPGRHQHDNAEVAIAVLQQWSKIVQYLPTDAIVTGLTQAEWPARLEWLHVPSEGDVLIDAAHNPAGAEALASYLMDSDAGRLPIVFAAMADKNLKGMIEPLLPIAASFIATTVPAARARGAEQLAAEIRALAPDILVDADPSPERAVHRALAAHGRVVAAGSIYMIGPLRATLIAGGAIRK